MHGADHHCVHGAECFLQCVDGDDDSRGRTVGVGDYEACSRGGGGLGKEALLLWYHSEVVCVDEGDDKRDIGISAEVFGVGEYGEVDGAEGGFWGMRRK